MRFVENVLKLQNDMTRPVYVFEVDPSISKADVEYIDRSMGALGVACVLVPSKLVRYVGEVDSKSFGQENLKTTYLGWNPDMVGSGI